MAEKPAVPNFEEYEGWLQAGPAPNFNSAKFATNYRANVVAIHGAAQQHPFFLNLGKELEKANADYERESKFPLIELGRDLQLQQKDYQSALEKSYRVNCIWNKRFPEPPKNYQGWLAPDQWFEKLDDLVRCRIFCQFADGPHFLANHLRTYAKSFGLDAEVRSVESEDGYYAVHFYLKLPVTITRQDWSEAQIIANIEIQLATILQQVLRDLSHKVYERRRLEINPDKKRWKWDFSSPHFMAGYLGHSLHLIEGLLINLRNQMKPEEKREEMSRTEPLEGSTREADT